MKNLGFQRISFKPLGFSGEIAVKMGLDFSIKHELAAGWDQTTVSGASVKGINFWNCPMNCVNENTASILGQTINSNHTLFSSMSIQSNCIKQKKTLEEDKLTGFECVLDLTEGKTGRISRVVTNYWKKTADIDQVWNSGKTIVDENAGMNYNNGFDLQCQHWNEAWKNIDIEIEGDDDYQQGVRYSIFNLHQIYQGKAARTNIPCKGLTGEVYDGQIFWDTESYTLPFYIFTNPQAARKLLEYRYNHLPQAKQRAREMDQVGARYPMCTLDGSESCATWQHGDFEIHVNVAISYAIWLYNKLCNDSEFLFGQGAEMLVEISRFFAKRGEFSPKRR